MKNNKEEYIKKYMKRYFEEIVWLNTKYLLGFGMSDLIKNSKATDTNLPVVFTSLLYSLKFDIIVTLSSIFDIKVKELDKNLKEAGRRSDCNIIKFLIKIKYLNLINVDINEDIILIKDHEKIIKNILKRRDELYAHFDKEYFFNPIALDFDAPLIWLEIKKLIDLALNIINKYSLKIENNEYHAQFTHIDDEIELFKKIFIKYFADIKSSKEKYLSEIIK